MQPIDGKREAICMGRRARRRRVETDGRRLKKFVLANNYEEKYASGLTHSTSDALSALRRIIM